MIDFVKLFRPNNASQESQGTLATAFQEAFSSLPDESVTKLTALAGLLGKVANAEGGISEIEKEKILAILEGHLGLTQESLTKAVTLAVTYTKDLAGIEDFRYTRLVNDTASKAEKLELIDLLLQVAAADSDISAEEDRMLGSIAEGLRLTRRDYLTQRSHYRTAIAAIRNIESRLKNE